MRILALVSAILIASVSVLAQSAGEKAAAAGEQTVNKALEYFAKNQQANGSWQRLDREPPAVTALVLKGFVQSEKYGPKSEPAKKAIDYIFSQQQANGGIYKDMLANYNTAIAISAIAPINDAAHKERLAKALEFLKTAQFSDKIAGPNGEKIDANHPFYGGFNYGGARGGRPDVSNTAIALEALNDSGLAKDDPAYKIALDFLKKMQNNSETNPHKWAGNDGGFIYSTGKAGEGESAAGEYTGADGKRMVRSYGSMTYAGLKSMIYAGLAKDDARVKAAWDWVRTNWTLDEHPGMSAAGAAEAKSGIYYYYNTLARALAAYGEPVIEDKKGAKHDWRIELLTKLAAIQNPDGSFTGAKRWMEDNPTISTSFAILAAQEALADLKKNPAK